MSAARVLPAAVLALLLGLVLWIYHPGITGPALLDDHSSLGALSNLADTPEQAWDYVLGEHSGPLGRSVSMATFVLEQLVGEGGTETSKLFNIGLHLLIGAVVAWLFALLLAPWKTPRVGLAAVLTTGIWLLAPLQVSTVLYLVQRMAMLSALFTLLSLVCYLYWRRALAARQPRYIWLLLCGLFLVLGVFAKENALVGIPLILLTEACWLQFGDDRGRTISWLRRLTWGLIVVGVLAACLLLAFYWDTLLQRYHIREFTPVERLLTQSRILWDYVAQFYWPDLDRLGVYHDDFPLSTSLNEPAGTLFAIGGWLAVLLAAALAWRWPAGRRLALGPLFFLAGHYLESTVWPLELYFEHRNYLPSVGLALLPLAIYALLAERWRELSRPLLAWTVVALVVFAALTSSQVQIWSKAPLLALQQVNGHSESARANRELAQQLAAVGARDAALKYSEAAYRAAGKFAAAGDEHHGDYLLRNLALACIARQPLTAVEYREIGREEPERPLGTVSTLSVVIKLRQNDTCPNFDWNGFLDHLAMLYLHDFNTRLASPNMFTALAMLANAAQRWEDAHAYTARSLALAPGRTRELLMQLHFSIALGREKEAKSLIDQLQALQDAGKLNRGERDTLALYLGERT